MERRSRWRKSWNLLQVEKNGGISSRVACVNDWSTIGCAMRDSKPIRSRSELLRIRKIRKAWADPKRRARRSEAAKKLWADPDYRQRVIEGVRNALADPEVLERRSSAIKAASADPRSRARKSKAITKSWKDPAHRAKRREGLKKRWQDSGYRSKQSEARRNRWKDPDFRRKQSEAHARLAKDPEYRAKMSKSVTEALADPEKRARHLAGRYRAAATLLQRQAGASHSGSAPRRGRPSMDDRNRSAVILHERGLSWRKIAEKLDPDFAKDPLAAMDRVRFAARNTMRSKKMEDGPR
jgi:hypothetical protein